MHGTANYNESRNYLLKQLIIILSWHSVTIQINITSTYAVLDFHCRAVHYCDPATPIAVSIDNIIHSYESVLSIENRSSFSEQLYKLAKNTMSSPLCLKISICKAALKL